MMLAVVDWPTVVVAGAALLVSAVFGWPTWRNAATRRKELRHAEKMAGELADERRTALNVARLIFGPGVDLAEPTSPEHPALADTLRDIRENTADMAALVAVVAYHVMDGHGGDLPDWLHVPNPPRRR